MWKWSDWVGTIFILRKGFWADLHKDIFSTVKLGDKKQFDKEQIGVKEPFPVTNLAFTS